MRDEYDFSKAKKRSAKKVNPNAGKLPISLRLDGNVISSLKDEALRLGIPYQTLIGSILYRFVTGELVDAREDKKIKKMVHP